MPLAPTEPSHGGPSAATTPAPSPSAARETVVPDWVCPFCALLCDDVAVARHADGTLAAPGTDCPRLARALAQFGAHDAAAAPLLDGQPVAPDLALDAAAAILRRARRPLFGGLATDVAGARALYPLAASCGAIVDHLHGDAAAAALVALQDRGGFFTTLSEVRTRADLLVIVGCRPSARYPRFYARVAAHDKRALFVACEPDPALNEPHPALLADADLHDVLALWSALANGRRAAALDDGTAPIGAQLAALDELQRKIAAARYTAFVYEPAALPGPHAALLIDALHRIVKTLNLTTRAACVPLGGDDGAATVGQTFAWLSGFPLRTHVRMPERPAGVAPFDHDPHRYASARVMAETGAIDALLWIASFGPERWPAALADDVPAVVFGHPQLADTARARTARTVFFPVATPGIDARGHLFRVDGSVVLPLTAARGAPLPGVATLAAQLSTRLARFADAACGGHA